ncbi:azurin [Variovorax sp. J31P207]|uniref:azurin n=1 Tax=Variovorax sp. J31P207 TaxID=3053510 RepID=UPI002574F982|nr:azurin [Variovorax sp. J31P207]MDM0071565.1 azurin [Variovorax sp. J31P207]
MKTPSRVFFALVATAAGLFAAPDAMAADCTAVVESNDAMQFNVRALAVPKACQVFAVTLKHVGKLPKAAMGHNLVITKAVDMGATATDGIVAGVTNDYVKPQDARVIAHSKLIGGGETTTVEIAVAKLAAGTDYVFFCSFPGHSAIMKGTLALKGS